MTMNQTPNMPTAGTPPYSLNHTLEDIFPDLGSDPACRPLKGVRVKECLLSAPEFDFLSEGIPQRNDVTQGIFGNPNIRGFPNLIFNIL